MFPLILLLSALLWSGTAVAQDVTNPIWRGNWPDPTVWVGDDGRYHCIATNPTRSIVSDDLFHWEMSEVAPVDINSWGAMSAVAQRFWAPDVATVDGKRNMYLTLYNSAEDSNIAVLQEYAPCQFRYVGIITSSRETGIHDTIDPEVVTDPKTGKVWLFFGSVGGIHRVELNKDGLSLKEKLRRDHLCLAGKARLVFCVVDTRTAFRKDQHGPIVLQKRKGFRDHARFAAQSLRGFRDRCAAVFGNDDVIRKSHLPQIICRPFQ